MKRNFWLSAMLLFVLSMSTAWSAPPSPSSEVPIGTVLDWWRPDATWLVPDGYHICDGGIVADPGSPFLNLPLPNLTDKFVMGVTDPLQIGTSGGSAGHSHSTDIDHAHSMAFTSLAGAHIHTIDVPLYSATVQTNASGVHNHEWLRFFVNPEGKKVFITYDTSGTAQLTTIWSNGIDDAGAGIYPFAKMGNLNQDFFTTGGGGHLHNVNLSHDHPAFKSALSGSHNHSLTVPPLGTQFRQASVESNVPPYFGLLKIMRIR